MCWEWGTHSQQRARVFFAALIFGVAIFPRRCTRKCPPMRADKNTLRPTRHNCGVSAPWPDTVLSHQPFGPSAWWQTDAAVGRNWRGTDVCWVQTYLISPCAAEAVRASYSERIDRQVLLSRNSWRHQPHAPAPSQRVHKPRQRGRTLRIEPATHHTVTKEHGRPVSVRGRGPRHEVRTDAAAIAPQLQHYVQ